VIQDHPGKQLNQDSTWFDQVKKSQAKYLRDMPSEVGTEI